ncbi:MAG: protein jag [Spirochaetes bacterium]|nr:protein jag [Spirochaetota bacterium]
MEYEFEGKTEMEAIDAAAAELGLARDEFDVEIVESVSGGLFKKGKVKIRIHLHGNAAANARKPERKVEREPDHDTPGEAAREPVRAPANPEATDEFERQVIDFTRDIVEKMGYSGKVSVLFREEKKLGLRLESDNASILIGKKGKNLDAIQLLANVYVSKLGREDIRIVLDSENYRIRREESLVRLAYETAEKVRRTKQSSLLEPMNPFERRIIHTTLNDIVDVETKSEGEGLYKQVRVLFKGAAR